MIDFDDYFLGADDVFQARIDTAFKKRHGWLRNVNGLICNYAILKYRHGSLPLFFYRPQINTDWHRLRAKGSDQDDY